MTTRPAGALPASTLTHLECSVTGEHHDSGEVQTISRAGHSLLARYDLERARRTLDRAALAGRPTSMWRYAEVMPVGERRHVATLGEGMTPLLRAPRLGRELGLERLMVKDEGQNPTGTFKSRGLSAAVSRSSELGVTDVALPTAGNAGAAAAAYAARAGLRCHVAMPRDAPETVKGEVRSYGAELELVDGLIDDAGRVIAEGCEEHGWLNLATLKEPYRLEGKKTMGYELWEQLAGELPDVIVYPTGGGTGLIGMWKAFAELEELDLLASGRKPRMIAVQSTGCAPIVRAWEAGDERAERWEDAETVAPGIRVPSAFADHLILDALRQSAGRAVAVKDEAILDAMRRMSRLEGFDPAPEGAATLAALDVLVRAGHVEADERVVLFDCGTGLKHPELRPG